MTARVALVALFFILSPGLRADWHFDADTGIFYNDNLSKSDIGEDQEDDWAWKSDVRAGYNFQLARDLRLNLTGDFGGEVWEKFDAFNNVDIGAAAGLRYRFGLGRQAPWILAENRLAHEFFDEDVRNGWANDFRITGGIAITDRLSIEAGYVFDHFAARDDFFDLEGHRGSLRLIFDVTSALQLSIAYSYRYGDVISYAEPPRPDLLEITSDRQPVNSFGIPQYIAYRLQADTHSISVSGGYALTRNVSVQVTYEYANTSHHPLTYENHFVEAKVALVY